MSDDFTETLRAWLLADPERVSILKALSDEAASEAQPAKQVSPSATGCADAQASSNPEADSSVRCADEKRSRRPSKVEQLLDCMELWLRADLRIFKDAFFAENLRHRLDTLSELRDELSKPPGAAPCGQRASRRNGQAERQVKEKAKL